MKGDNGYETEYSTEMHNDIQMLYKMSENGQTVSSSVTVGAIYLTF